MKGEKYIDFVLNVEMEGMHFSPHRAEGIEFRPSKNENLRIVIKPKEPEVDACGNRLGLIFKIYNSYSATESQVSFVDFYNRKNVMLRVAEGVNLPIKNKDHILIDEDGAWEKGYSPPRTMCPLDILNIIEFVESDLWKKANRMIKLLRWSQCCDAESEILKSSSLYWRIDDGDYPHVPSNNSSVEITIKAMHGIHWSDDHFNDLKKLWIIKDLEEPLGHALFREASVLATDSPLSSILILATALETAVKIHISNNAPLTAWLMEEIQTPPIDKILRNYIPIVHKKLGKDMSFWDTKQNIKVSEVQKFFNVRNKVAHTGKTPIDAKPIKEYLELVSDFLYLIDVLDGHDWAKTLVSSNLRLKLGWPAPKDPRVHITIRS